MTTLRILIVDDEELARRRLVRLLAELPGVELVGECDGGQAALARLREPDADVDVVLLDIRMPGLTGLETAALLGDDGPYVVFTTAHDDHAVDAFDLGVVDYLLKPIEAVRLHRALERARQRLGGQRGGSRELVRLPVTTREGIILVDPQVLTHAVFDGALVTLHLDGRTLLTDQSLQDLEDRLSAAAFERVHRRALVNLEKIERLEPLETGGYNARMPGGDVVPISRQAARRLRRRLGLS
ncbi:LytR/AlgR family response regulator transcription factor [Nannocystis pusilla]|uniref:LytR/AlgR family response regulator transcription factor n=1 Tax=Nannocystis pusilla TaxID=889268 RepID=UPI003DA2D67B